MQKVMGVSGIILGVGGVLGCAAIIGIAWWIAAKSTARLDRMSSRLIQGLSEVDRHLTRVASRVNSIQSEIKTIQSSAATIAAENPELPQVKAAIETLLEKMTRPSERVDALLDSIQSISTGLRTASDLIDDVKPDARSTAGTRAVADKIDQAAELLKSVQTKIEESKLNKAIEITQELVNLARRTVEGCDRLSEGLAGAREEVATLTRRTTELCDDAVFWIRAFATTITFIGLWGGLGQLCLFGWGRRLLRFEGQAGQ